MKKVATTHARTDIAVIGMSCRFPGADHHEQFWLNLKQGKNSIAEITPDRWSLEEYYSPKFEQANKSVSKWCGLVEGVERFDHQFFNISPREANNMDPQQRLLLEETWHCVEDAGVALRELQAGNTAVYMGVMAADYRQEASAPHLETDSYAALGGYECILANRISHFFDLKGPSMSINAACASSLVAIHEAKRSLLTGESDFAIAGGVNLNLHPWKYISFSKSRMLSPDGQCKTFDMDANGYVPGDGVGVLLLQRLDDALAAGHRIYGIIKGSAVNHVGRSQSITAPRVEAQQEVILHALQDAGVDPRTVGYVEAHGTGTSLGDPIEVESLTQAFRKFTQDRQFCKIGSVKTNIGHLEAAAGVAGVIKVLLMMRHRQIPQTLNIKTLNPMIDFERSPFAVANQLDEWQRNADEPLRAGVSSFGFGGANSHVLVEEYRPVQAESSADDQQQEPVLFLLSAKSKASLDRLVQAWQAFARSERFAQMSLQDLSMTLLKGREALPFRIGKLVRDKGELVRFLQEVSLPDQRAEARPWQLCVGELTWHGSAQVQALTHAFPSLGKHLEHALATLLSAEGVNASRKSFRLKRWKEADRPLFSFVVNEALLRMILAAGAIPHSVAGAGAGVWNSLSVSGMIEPQRAMVKLLTYGTDGDQLDADLKRPQIPFVDLQTGRSIAAIRIDAEYLQALLTGLLAQDLEESSTYYIEKAKLLLKNQFTFKRYMEDWNSVLQAFDLSIDRLFQREATLGEAKRVLLFVIASSLRKLNRKWNLSEQKVVEQPEFYELLDLLTDEVVTPEMIVELLLSEQPDFAALAEMMKSRQHRLQDGQEYRLLRQQGQQVQEIEDPAAWIEAMLKAQTAELDDEQAIVWGHFNHEQARGRPLGANPDGVQEFLLQLWLRGVPIRWDSLLDGREYRPHRLPSYPFDRRAFWLPRPTGTETERLAAKRTSEQTLHPPLTEVAGGWTRSFSVDDAVVQDHLITGHHLLPGASLLETANELIAQKQAGAVELRDVLFQRPGLVEPAVTLSVDLEPTRQTFSIQQGAQTLCVGKYGRGHAGQSQSAQIASALRDVRWQDAQAVYELFEQRGYQYGPTLRVLHRLQLSTDTFWFDARVAGHGASGQKLSANLLDGIFQAAIAVQFHAEGMLEGRSLYVPYLIRSMTVFAPLDGRCFIRINKGDVQSIGSDFCAQMHVYSETGQPVLSIDEMIFKRVEHSFLQPNLPEESLNLWRPEWQEQPPFAECAPTSGEGATLIFGDALGVGERLAAELGNAIFISPAEDGQAVLKQLAAEQISIRKIYYLRGMASEEELLRAERAEVPAPVLELFQLGKALAHIGQSAPQELIIVTRKLQAVLPQDQPEFPFAAALHGIGKVMARENRQLQVRLIDLDADDLQASVQMLAVESGSAPLHEVAYRDGRRYVRVLAQAVEATPDRQVAIRPRGVYLIVGGLGGIGLEVARHLLENFQANIVLVGRRQHDQTVEQQLATLRALGGDVLYRSADVTDRSSMEAVIDQTKRQYGALHGVIHSALLLADGLMRNMTEASFRQAFVVKYRGAQILHQVTAGEALDFLVFFSSILALQGNAGQCNYVAGCSFMDSFAHYLRKSGQTHAVALNWGYWGEVGIVANERFRKLLAEQGFLALRTQEGIAGFQTAIERGSEQIVVAKIGADRLAQMTAGEASGGAQRSEAAHAAIGRQIEREAAMAFGDQNLLDGMPEIERFGISLLVQGLQRRGVLLRAGERDHREQLVQKIGLIDRYSRWFDAVLDLLSRHQFIRLEQGRTMVAVTDRVSEVAESLTAEAMRAEQRRLLDTYPDKRAHVALIEQAMATVDSIWSGEMQATQILFPNSSLQLVEGFYHGNRFSDYYNDLVARFLLAIAEQHGGATGRTDKLRILEIGAGTGGTSQAVLQKIAPLGEGIDYWYTDISPAFVKHGRNRFSQQYPFTQFTSLAINKMTPDKAEQLGAFDLIFATNVIHATPNLTTTLQQIRSLLKPGGRLVLNELCYVQDFLTLTFGLLDGWWLYEDMEVRLPHSPLLDPTNWSELLSKNGFADVAVFGQPDRSQAARQIVIVGRQASPVVASAAPSVAASVVRTADELIALAEEQIKAKVAQVLEMNVEDLPEDQVFSEIGVDSIVAVELISELNQSLQIALSPTTLFDYHSVQKLAEHLAERYADELIRQSLPTADVATKGNLIAETVKPQRPATSRAELNASNRVRQIVCQKTAEVLLVSTDELDEACSFHELGVDSIVGVELVNALNEQLQLSLSPSVLYDHTSVLQLTEHICSQIELFQHFEEAVATKEEEVVPAVRPTDQFARPSSVRTADTRDIAIIGYSGRFAGARNTREFWSNLSRGVNSIGEIPADRWSIEKFYDPDPLRPGKSSSKWGGFLTDVDRFDPLFFNISPVEAELMDPQQRQFLMECWNTLEMAGYSEKMLNSRSCGVYVGVMNNDYQEMIMKSRHDLSPAHALVGNSNAILPARIAYLLNLKGPALAIDTACSSSLVAMHLACKTLQDEEAEMMLAGGVTLYLTESPYIRMSKLGMLSPEGKCKTFDNGADGFVPGEGVGAVLLKRLDKAIRDQDMIFGVIKGSATNQDGKTNGITAPSKESQKGLELSLYREFDIDPSTISYVEAHGTGTKLGDPIEIEALSESFRAYTDRKQFCAIGSVKTNIGHTSAAAGVAGVIKTILSLKHGKLAPSLHYRRANEYINFANSPFYVNTELRDWLPVGDVRRAAVSSFGFSGTNCHMVIEEAPRK